MAERVDRDEALARLAAPLTRQGAGGAGAGCPDADTLGGYLDRSLDEAERRRWEEHFAGCARCQNVLADLARLEPPAPQVEPAPSPAVPWLGRFRWQWLAPAAAVLTVGIVWTLVRPTSGPVSPAMVQSAVPAAEPRGEAVTTPGQRLGQVEARRSEPAQPVSEGQSPRPAAKPPAPARLQAELKDAAPAAPAERGKGEAQAASKPSVAGNVMEQLADARRASALTVQKAADAARPAAPTAQPPAADRVTLEAVAASRGAAAQMVSAKAATSANRIVSSPAQSVSWRIGPEGSVERSTDGQHTWQKQKSGTTAALSAASAPSDTVCWIVGQYGTVIRTTDGQTWEVLTPPALVDLVSVSARDAMAATVVAADGRLFMTTDGGRTWRAP